MIASCSKILWPCLLMFCGMALMQGAEAVKPKSQPHAASASPLWVTKAVPAPRVSHHVFASKSAKADVSYHLYRPAAYDADGGRRFPVVYWLHGSGGGLPGIPSVAKRFDAAIEAGKLPPCLVVFVNGLEMGMYVDWADGSAPVESMIIRDLLPQVDATYRTIAKREGRLLDGFSMGGYGAARLGFKYPELFRAVSIVGAGPMQAELKSTPRASRIQAEDLLKRAYGGEQSVFLEASPRKFAQLNAKKITQETLVRMVIGEKDETFANNFDFHRHLESVGIPHGWTVIPGVGHEPERVFEALGDANWEFYRKAFSPESPPEARAAQGELKIEVGKSVRRALYSNVPAQGKRPAVIVLHGGMGSAEQMRATSGFETLAAREGFIAVYPEGTEFSGGRHAWNTGHLLRRQVRDADDVAFLDALIDRLVSRHGADPARIFLTGGSNGGMMTYVYATARADRLAAAAPVVASMFTFAQTPGAPLPILIINGGRDSEVPLVGGMSGNPLVRSAQATPFQPVDAVVAFWSKANRCADEPKVTVTGSVTTKTYAPTAGGAPVEYVLDDEGGHGWPGTVSRRAENQPIRSFKGAERVWDFFKDKVRVAGPK
jgi:poly(3-hydroxybutyrate) depolymerase